MTEFRIKDAYEDVGRAIVHAAWLERSITGLRAQLDGNDEASWDRAEKAPTTTNIEECLKRLRAQPDQNLSVDDLIRALEAIRDLLVTRHHLVHGITDQRSGGEGVIVWKKHERQGGQHWSKLELDSPALRDFANNLALWHGHLNVLKDEILPRVITMTTIYPDGRVEECTSVAPPHPRHGPDAT